MRINSTISQIAKFKRSERKFPFNAYSAGVKFSSLSDAVIRHNITETGNEFEFAERTNI